MRYFLPNYIKIYERESSAEAVKPVVYCTQTTVHIWDAFPSTPLPGFYLMNSQMQKMQFQPNVCYWLQCADPSSRQQECFKVPLMVFRSLTEWWHLSGMSAAQLLTPSADWGQSHNSNRPLDSWVGAGMPPETAPPQQLKQTIGINKLNADEEGISIAKL